MLVSAVAGAFEVGLIVDCTFVAVSAVVGLSVYVVIILGISVVVCPIVGPTIVGPTLVGVNSVEIRLLVAVHVTGRVEGGSVVMGSSEPEETGSVVFSSSSSIGGVVSIRKYSLP